MDVRRTGAARYASTPNRSMSDLRCLMPASMLAFGSNGLRTLYSRAVEGINAVTRESSEGATLAAPAAADLARQCRKRCGRFRFD